jgi:hypothetical protein
MDVFFLFLTKMNGLYILKKTTNLDIQDKIYLELN